MRVWRLGNILQSLKCLISVLNDKKEVASIFGGYGEKNIPVKGNLLYINSDCIEGIIS